MPAASRLQLVFKPLAPFRGWDLDFKRDQANTAPDAQVGAPNLRLVVTEDEDLELGEELKDFVK
jgi:hypothetical protein